MQRGWCSIVVVVALLASTPCAHAQTSAPDKATGEALFREGRALLRSGDVAEACAKFEASHRLDPQTGTLFNLAACHERQGKTSSAWAEYAEVVERDERGTDKERLAFAKRRQVELARRLSRIRLTVPPGDITIRIGGRAIAPAALSSALPVDPGEVVVEASSPGKKTYQTKLSVAVEAKTTDITIPPLEDAPPEKPPILAPPPPASEAAPLRAPHHTEAPSKAPMLVALGVGAVGLGVGAYFGLDAFSKKSSADDACPLPGRCTPRGLSLDDEARTSATVSTVAFAVAGAALATSVVLWLVSKSPRAEARVVGPRVTF